MGRPRVDAGGGVPAILYSLKKGQQAGGLWNLTRRLMSKNTCKTCAFGMGGARGGMRNEQGRWPEVCKKSIQAQAGDMQAGIPLSFFAQTPIEELARYTSAQMEALGRITHPLLAGPDDTHFRPVPWDQALDHVGEALRGAPPEEAFFYASGRSSNEAAYLLQLIARAYGTANIHNCSYYCHQASGVGLGQVYGSGTASVTLDDLEHADLALVVGANPASNHPRLIRYLVELRRRGGKVVVINPLKELGLVRFRVPSDVRSLLGGSDVSDLYLQPRVGGDVALFKALLKGLVERDALDAGFVADATTGADAVLADARAASWSELLAACGVSRVEVDQTVEILAESRNGISMWAMGLTHHTHGVDNILGLANLHLARGWLGRPGAGLMPIRGHSNVQGVGSVGVSPRLKEAFARRLEEVYDIRVPAVGGQDTYASMEAAAAGRIRAAVLLGGNLWGSNPDLEWASRALRNIPVTATLSTKMNPGHVHGRGQTAYILPVLTRDEESQATTQESMFNYVRLSEGGTPHVSGDLRGEVDAIASLAERVLGTDRFDWTRLRSHDQLRREIARVVPGYAPLADIGTTLTEFQIPGRTFHVPRFPTPDGRARFHVTPVPDLGLAEDQLALMTLRSEGQFNTVVYDEEDLYRGNSHRNVVMMNAGDAARRGLAEGQPVVVRSATGEMRVEVSIVDIAPGSLAMYYPEANALVDRKVDPRSKTPAFKFIPVTVEPE